MKTIPAATVALAALAVALAAPTSAEPIQPDQVTTGMYKMHFTDGALGDMTYQATSCGVGCSNVAFANAAGQARFYADRWHLDFLQTPAAWSCPDGSAHPGVVHMAWSPATGIGEMMVARVGAACGYSSHNSETMARPFIVTSLGSSSGQPSVLAPVPSS